MKLRLLLGTLVVGLVSACGGSDDSSSGGGGGGGGGGGDGTLVVKLDAVGGSGKTGKAELYPGPASVDVTIEMTKGQSESDVIHVHKGTCDSPSKEVAHDLGFTTASLGQGQIFQTLDEVATGEYVIDVHEDETPKVIMCGVIPEQ